MSSFSSDYEKRSQMMMMMTTIITECTRKQKATGRSLNRAKEIWAICTDLKEEENVWRQWCK